MADKNRPFINPLKTYFENEFFHNSNTHDLLFEIQSEIIDNSRFKNNATSLTLLL